MATPLPRRIRLVTGMVVFAYVATHLCNLALGLVSLDAMDRWRPVFLWVWQTPPGLVALYGSMMIHLALGLRALFEKRTLRMTGFDTVQLLLALAIPPLLVIHVLGTRGARLMVDLEPTYAWIMMLYWKWDPWTGLRQVLVLLAAWVHGCMGLYYWMRLQGWWPRVRGALYPLALVVPVAALLGLVEGGKAALAAAGDPAWMQALRADTASLDTSAVAAIYRAQTIFLWSYAAVLVAVLAARAWRVHASGACEPVQIAYQGGPTIQVPPGLSLLDASRAREIPHASVCGGRGRCGTCRVRIVGGAEHLPAPSVLESQTLARVRAGADVRLACQTVPLGSPVAIERLLPADDAREALAHEHDVGAEARDVVVLVARVANAPAVIEARGATDALFLIGRRLDAAIESLESAGARVERSDAIGLRAVFGVDGTANATAILESARELAAARESLAVLATGVHAGEAFLGVANEDGDGRPTLIGEALETARAIERALDDAPGSVILSPAFAGLAGLDDDAVETIASEPPSATPPRLVRLAAQGAA